MSRVQSPSPAPVINHLQKSVYESLRCSDQQMNIIGMAGSTETMLQDTIEAGSDRIMQKPLRLHPILDLVNELRDLT